MTEINMEQMAEAVAAMGLGEESGEDRAARKAKQKADCLAAIEAYGESFPAIIKTLTAGGVLDMASLDYAENVVEHINELLADDENPLQERFDLAPLKDWIGGIIAVCDEGNRLLYFKDAAVTLDGIQAGIGALPYLPVLFFKFPLNAKGQVDLSLID